MSAKSDQIRFDPVRLNSTTFFYHEKYKIHGKANESRENRSNHRSNWHPNAPAHLRHRIYDLRAEGASDVPAGHLRTAIWRDRPIRTNPSKSNQKVKAAVDNPVALKLLRDLSSPSKWPHRFLPVVGYFDSSFKRAAISSMLHTWFETPACMAGVTRKV
jgi:hypothetical protein